MLFRYAPMLATCAIQRVILLICDVYCALKLSTNCISDLTREQNNPSSNIQTLTSDDGGV